MLFVEVVEAEYRVVGFCNSGGDEGGDGEVEVFDLCAEKEGEFGGLN